MNFDNKYSFASQAAFEFLSRNFYDSTKAELALISNRCSHLRLLLLCECIACFNTESQTIVISAKAENARPHLLMKIIWKLNESNRIFLSELHTVIVHFLSEASISIGYASRSTSLNVKVSTRLLLILLRLIVFLINSSLFLVDFVQTLQDFKWHPAAVVYCKYSGQ